MSVIPLKVAIRVRPLIQKEKDEGCQTCLNFIPYEPQIVMGKDRSFTYDFVFRPTDPQITVYEDAVKPLLEHIFKGFNATVLAYGQTGSGKTFTMGGGYEESLKMDPEGMGIIPRIVQEIFLSIQEKDTYTFKTYVSYLEIINEDLQDLLVTGKRDSLAIREENGVIKLPGLKEVPVQSTEDTMRYLEQGCNNRTTAATAMNNSSSRSHAIFSLIIEQHNEADVNDFWKAKLQLVDLAGSERIKKTHAEGQRLKEGININKGLLALGNVISILGDETKKASHVPYRDSKLTRILQDSLGGNSHTLMIACVSPADSNMEETLNTLRYADRARKIKNKPVVNWDPQTAEIMKLKAQVQQLTMRLISAGLSELDSDSDINLVKPESPKMDSKTVQIWKDKCRDFEIQVEILHKDLCKALDQASDNAERALRWETKWERLRSLLEDFESTIGVDFDLLSSTITEETNPAVVEQLDKLKGLFNKLHSLMGMQSMGVQAEDSVSIIEEEDEEIKDKLTDEIPSTPESRERVQEYMQQRNRLHTELTELEKILAQKEKLAQQMAQNDKMKELKEQYEGSMKQLEDEITSLQKEKEVLSAALEDARTNAAASKLSESRRKRLQELEGQMSELKRKLADQKKLLKVKDQTDKKVTQLNSEIQSMKQQRVKLMKQMKEEADQWRKWRQQKDKEVLQLQQKERKRQFEIQKLQRENQRAHSVLQRKSEEAAAANRRLKEALARQKQVLEERNQKFEKCDKNNTGMRIRKILGNELEVLVSIMEAKYHRESQLQDRKSLAEQLKALKESLSDEAPPSKKMAWMDQTGTKHETSFQEEEVKKKIHHLEQQIELRNIQIQDLQQKIFDAEQESKGKSIRDNAHTMMEAKIAIKWLLEQAATRAVDCNRLQTEIDELKLSESDNNKDNNEIIVELEDTIRDMKKAHERKITKLLSEHQEEIEVLLASTSKKPERVKTEDTGEENTEEVRLLKEENEKLKKTVSKLERHLTKYMYKDKSVALLPELTDDESSHPESRSPFITQRPKRSIASKSVLGIPLTEESVRSSDEFEKPLRPLMRKSVSAGMLRSKRPPKSRGKHKIGGDVERLSENSGKMTESTEVNEEEKDQYLKKLRKRSGRIDFTDMFADSATDTNDEEEKAQAPKKAKALRKKTSRTNIQKIDAPEEVIPNTPGVEKPLKRKTSKSKLHKTDTTPEENVPEKENVQKGANLNETFTSVSEESEKSTTLNETFTTTCGDSDLLDELDEGLKKKRRLFNTTKSFFKPVEFHDANM